MSPVAKEMPWKLKLHWLGVVIEKVNVSELAALCNAALGKNAPFQRLLMILGILTPPILITFGISGSLYSDYALGSIALNMVGVPGGENEWLFWGFFAFKRLPMSSA